MSENNNTDNNERRYESILSEVRIRDHDTVRIHVFTNFLNHYLNLSDTASKHFQQLKTNLISIINVH